MNAAAAKEIVRVLSASPHHVRFEAGLSRGEIAAAETRFDFAFPPDLRAFLQYGLPTGERFPNWRLPNAPGLREQIAWPADGVLFDVRESAFWLESWGPRPKAMEDALDVAAARLRAAPKLIPIYGHRYVCEQPQAAGNPVISAYQTDIIYYGSNLSDYFQREFASPPHPDRPFASEPERVPFWSEIIDQ